MSDINTINELGNAFEEFKSANDQRLAEIEKKGTADVVLSNKVDAINDTLTELQKKMQRPVIGELNEAETEHKQVWNNWARKGDRYANELETVEKKALTVQNNTDGSVSGGVAIPKVVEAGIYESLLTLSPIRQLAQVISVSSPDYRILVDNRDMGAGWVGEVDPRPETKAPTLSELRVPFGEVYANPFVSQQALDDLAFDVENFITGSTATKFAQMENTAFIAGTGNNQPQGILTTSGITTIKTGAAAGMPTNADYIFSMIQTLPKAYRQGASFITASATVTTVRTLKDSTGAYVWQPSLVVGTPSTLAGFAITEVEDMPSVAANSLPIAFGNVAQGYLIADRIGIRTLRDPYTNKPFVGFYSTKRVGGMVRDKAAFVFLQVKA